MARRAFWLLRSLAIPSILSTALGGAACGGDDPPPPPPTVLELSVLDAATDAPIAGAQLVILERPGSAAAQALSARVPVAPGSASRPTSDASGLIRVELAPGRYVLRVDAARYLSVPEPFTPPRSVSVAEATTTGLTMRLEPLSGSFGDGSISGRVTRGGAPVAGVLVHAESTTTFATLSDADGTYVLLGLSPNLYRVEASLAGHEAAAQSNIDVGAAEVTGVNLDLNVVPGVTVTATIGGQAGTTSVALALASTGDPLPGGSARVDFGAQVSIRGVPPGRFTVVAALEDDDKVVSPDLLRLRTPAELNVMGTDEQRVALPIVPAITGLTVDTSSATPQFSWSPHPTATFYVVRVDDLRGRVYWGGLDARGQTLFRVRGTTVAFGDLGAPLSALESGHSYRVRVYAGREVPATGTYELLAGTEPRDGRFRAP